MKANAKELFEAVRAVVRDEIKKVLPEIVRQHLTEEYIKKMVLESAVPQKKKGKKNDLAELLTVTDAEDDEEPVPEPLENTDKGIYDQSTLTSRYDESRENPSVKKMKREMGPMSFVFEGVKIPGEAEEVVESIPSDAMDKVGFDFSRMNEVLSRAGSKSPMKESSDAKMREIEMRRKALEVPVNRK